MQRRELLEKVLCAASVSGLLGPIVWTSALADGNVVFDESTSGSMETLEDLRRGMKRLAMRDASEQSIPMLLTLENLAANSGNPEFVPESFNQQVAQKFEHYVDLLLQYKAEPEESDIANLIVLIAEDDLFTAAAGVCR